MQKIKLLLAMFFFLSFIQNVNAQFGGNSKVNNLTIVWDGDGGYRNNTSFTVKIQVNSQWLIHTFNGPGIWVIPNYIGGNNIGAIQGSINTISWGFNTTYWNLFNNAYPIGTESSHWLSTWNDKTWYWYEIKTSPTEWHCRIGN